MAGILANSPSHTMVSAIADNTQSGYVAGEKITLSTSPTGTLYSWGLSIPTGSTVARAGLDNTTTASPVFIPDVGGYYVITCTVDNSTSYVLRLNVADRVSVVASGAVTYAPIANASIPAPVLGATLYYSADGNQLSFKLPNNSVAAVGSSNVVTLVDAAAPTPPASGTLLLQSFNQQGFSVPHVYDTQGNAIEITRDNVTIVKNTSGGTINKGQVVYVTGSTGAVPTVSLAKADSSATMPAFGIMYENASNNAFGRMLILGNLENFDLSAFSNGQLLYVSAATAGALTATPPAYPNFAQTIGTVLNNGVGNGVLDVFTRVVQAQSSRQPTASAASTFSTTAGNVDATVFTVPSSPTGNGRFIINDIFVRLRTAIVGTGSVAVTVGASAGGVEYVTSQTLTSSTTVGVVSGLATSTLGASLPSTNNFRTALNPGGSVIVRWATTGTISAGAGDVYLFGEFLP